ncbi:MAG: heme biosynthesis HemY N-terminal domain-containing protein [Pseudomonadota bacterium]
MNLFRTLLFWILLALAGALLAQLLLQDPGFVLVRYLGTTIETTLVGAVLLLGAGLFALWLVWKALSWPFRLWRLRRERAARTRLAEGLDALHHGRYAEAETLLAQAALDPQFAAPARIAAARAAAARGDAPAANAHLDALAATRPLARAIALAEIALSEGRAADALAALDAATDTARAPRAAALRAEALAAGEADAPVSPAPPT